MTAPVDSTSPLQDAATMDWVGIRTLRDTLDRQLSEVPTGGHLTDADEPSDRTVRADWNSIVVASTNGLCDLLRLERPDAAALQGDAALASEDVDTRKQSALLQAAVLAECTASALLSNHEETQTSLRPSKAPDLMSSLLKTISGASGMELTLWTSGGAIRGTTTSLADFFSSTVDHLENNISDAHYDLLRQQSARLSNTAVLPNTVLLATKHGQKVAVRVEDISAWTLGVADEPASGAD